MIVRTFDSIPRDQIVKNDGDSPFFWRKRKATACGKVAQITDAFESEKYKVKVYMLLIEGRSTRSTCLFLEEDLEKINEGLPDWDIKYETAENLVIARLYIDGKLRAQGHGHVFHDEMAGYVQAASYAVKQIWLKFKESED